MTRPDPGLHDQRTWRTVLRVGGPIVFCIGLVLAGIGFISFFTAFGSFGGMPNNFWMAFIGLPLMGLGTTMIKAGYLGPASRYVAGEVSPTLRDTLGSLGIGGDALVCVGCGGRNAADAKFCDDCGIPLDRVCAACSASNAGDATFCDDCGVELPRDKAR